MWTEKFGTHRQLFFSDGLVSCSGINLMDQSEHFIVGDLESAVLQCPRKEGGRLVQEDGVRKGKYAGTSLGFVFSTMWIKKGYKSGAFCTSTGQGMKRGASVLR